MIVFIIIKYVINLFYFMDFEVFLEGGYKDYKVMVEFFDFEVNYFLFFENVILFIWF